MVRRKVFDWDEVLKKAMLLFWEQGYEATSMQDLVTRMGINRQSLYDTFGDKHALYVEALEHYRYGAEPAWVTGQVLQAGGGVRL